MFGRVFFIAVAATVVSLASNTLAQERVEHSLNGDWSVEYQLDQESESDGLVSEKIIKIPGTFEQQIAIDFDGVATFTKSIDPIEIGPQRRLLLHFDAVATHTAVWFNGKEVGQHLGGWTPFRFDVTEAALSKPDGPWEIKVQVDELVGHNTQGFLPIIAPHFGGIWQGVKLIDVPIDWIDELKAQVFLKNDEKELHVIMSFSAMSRRTQTLHVRKQGSMEWTRINGTKYASRRSTTDRPQRSFKQIIKLEDFDSNFEFQNWTPDNPVLYDFKYELETKDASDSVVVTVGFRDIETKDDHFLLNGKPVNFRGLLNWGYAPPGTAPQLDEAFMRSEIQFARDRGFNLMKFCLWIPPKRYLELCDEMGMMAWIEYPAWHPDFSDKHLEDLKQEYNEFFFYDRTHPCVMLRSLTCETGPSAELHVIEALTDQCKGLIPGAIVVDDSSWIAWNRVFDFYDDHPYGNNHTWVAELDRLKQFIAERETKPLMLGEAITSDTWTDPQWFPANESRDDHWQPAFLESSRDWLDAATDRFGGNAVQRLMADSKNYAMSQRKFQMETFRREVPGGGYVVSVIRDMPKAGMGLIDFQGNPKWKPDDWNWHGDTMITLKSSDDLQGFTRSFRSGLPIAYEFYLHGLDNSKHRFSDVRIHVEIDGAPAETLRTSYRDKPFLFAITDTDFVTQPTPVTVKAELLEKDSAKQECINEWNSWIFPDTVSYNSSIDECLLSSALDQAALNHLAEGGKVLLQATNEPNSFPTQSHWFLRGGPIVSDLCAELFDPEMLIALQPFDLASDVIRDIRYLDDIDPLFMLWEAHDLDHIKTNGLMFHMPVGESGNLFVTALPNDDNGNPASIYVRQKLLDEIINGDICDRLDDSMRGKENLIRLRQEISQRKIMLDQKLWRFQPDASEQALAGKWFATDHDDSEWQQIRIDRHWESQGHEQLDDWAWYRLSVELPQDWPEEKVYLNFTGVDDYYDVYVNGKKVGSGGDIEKRETAFELRTSHDLTSQVTPGKSLQITVAVYDWYGAGGIFRPAWISTQPISDKPRMLK